jgi:tetratricopeptide (TPR) repeat protein
MYVNVAVAAIAAAGIVVGLTLDTRTAPAQPKALPGKPPMPVNVPAQVRPQIDAAFASWPKGSIQAMQRLGLQHLGGDTPKERYVSAVVQYFRGVALDWAGYPIDGSAALERAKTLGKNTMIHNEADALNHRGFLQTGPPFYPVFQPSVPNALLQQGSRLQAQGHQVSAEHLYAKAAKLHPKDIEARVAVAVGLFDEDNLLPVMSRLGPLVSANPRSQAAHYYFGLVLAWTGQSADAITQFKQTVELDAKSPIGKQAEAILAGIAKNEAAAGN